MPDRHRGSHQTEFGNRADLLRYRLSLGKAHSTLQAELNNVSSCAVT
jgi:hypothetical protein